MPLVGNILVNVGIGPVILKNVDPTHPAPAPLIFWWIITGIGVVGAALLIQYLFWVFLSMVQLSSNPDPKWIPVLIAATGCIYFAPISLLGLSPFGFYDRYLVFLIPLAVFVVSTTGQYQDQPKDLKKNVMLMTLLMMILVYGVFTTVATHDYLSLNRVRWQALNDLMQKEEISPNKIDGGFEFNGWYLYDEDYEYDPTFTKSWYWVEQDDYIVTLTLISNRIIIKRYQVNNFFNQTKEILVLQ